MFEEGARASLGYFSIVYAVPYRQMNGESEGNRSHFYLIKPRIEACYDAAENVANKSVLEVI